MSETTGTTSATAVVLAVPLVIDQAIASFTIVKALSGQRSYGDSLQSALTITIAAVILLAFGAIYLLAHFMFGRIMLALGGLLVAVTHASILGSMYTGTSFGAAGFLGLLAAKAEVNDPLATAGLAATIIAGVLTAVFALLPATGRWCRRE